MALEAGPGGDIFYVSMDGGAVHRLVYSAANQPPVAQATTAQVTPFTTTVVVGSKNSLSAPSPQT